MTIRKITYVVSAGLGTPDHERVLEIADILGAESAVIDGGHRLGIRKDIELVATRILESQPDLVVVEGTGIRSGLGAMVARRRSKGTVRYLVSTGDPVGPFIGNRHGRAVGRIATAYERALYGRSAGVIGWTPYLVGRAIAMGAPGGVTVEGFVSRTMVFPAADSGAQARQRLDIPADALVVGVSGSINWSERQQYAYGLETVRAAAHVRRQDVYFVVIGDGSGLPRLKAGVDDGDRRFRFLGRVPREEMSALLPAFDVAVVGQTSDEVGLLRLTTKLPEYLAASVPVIMPAAPGLIDYFGAAEPSPVILLKRGHPASEEFALDVAAVIEGLDRDALAARRVAARAAAQRFEARDGVSRLRLYLASLEE